MKEEGGEARESAEEKGGESAEEKGEIKGSRECR
jgi:hypothetical protein